MIFRTNTLGLEITAVYEYSEEVRSLGFFFFRFCAEEVPQQLVANGSKSVRSTFRIQRTQYSQCASCARITMFLSPMATKILKKSCGRARIPVVFGQFKACICVKQQGQVTNGKQRISWWQIYTDTQSIKLNSGIFICRRRDGETTSTSTSIWSVFVVISSSCPTMHWVSYLHTGTWCVALVHGCSLIGIPPTPHPRRLGSFDWLLS